MNSRGKKIHNERINNDNNNFQALLKVVKGEEVGSEVKHSALGVLSNLCTDPAIRSKMYSDVLIKEVTKVLVEEGKGSEVRRFALLFLTNFCADAVNRFKAYSDGLMKVFYLGLWKPKKD